MQDYNFNEMSNNNIEGNVNSSEVINKKKSNKIVIVLMLIIVGLLTVIGLNYFGVINILNGKQSDDNSSSVNEVIEGEDKDKEDKESNSNLDKPVNNNIDIEKNYDDIYDIIGLTSKGYKRCEEEEEEFEKGKEYIDFNYLDLASVFISLDAGEYTVSSIGYDNIIIILMANALKENSISEVKGKNENDICSAGAGYCNTITLETYKKIAKKYNLNPDPYSFFKKEAIVDNKFNLYNGGSTVNYNSIEDSISLEDKGDIIVVNYNIKLTPVTIYSNSKVHNKNIKYVFKKKDGSFYLDTISIKNN